jgi:hypothetical protein
MVVKPRKTKAIFSASVSHYFIISPLLSSIRRIRFLAAGTGDHNGCQRVRAQNIEGKEKISTIRKLKKAAFAT